MIARPVARVRAGAIAWALVATTLGASTTPATADAAGRQPRVRLIATGGTIANAPAGRLSAEQLVAGLPGANHLARIEPETFTNVPSAALTLDDCARLSHHIVAVLAADPGLDGVVVTSGTDTLEEIAWFLYLTIPGDRPIVVVGAMRRPGPGADGPTNLADAVRVAGSQAARGRGTLVVMHGQVLAAREVRKQHATDLGAFDAPEPERAGTVKRGRVQLARAASPPLAPGVLPISGETHLPRVDVLLAYQGANGDLIEAAVANGARGIVVAAAGAGALTPSQSEAARRVARAGVPVVIASRTGAGTIAAADRPDDLPLLRAGDLAPLKARVLLTLALAHGMDARQIATLFAPLPAHAR